MNQDRKRSGNLIVVGVLGAIAFFIMLALFGKQSSNSPEGGDDASRIIARYGQPDKEDSTAYDNPRPPLVTRFLIYEPEHIRFVFVPKGKVGDPPPYQGWNLVGYQDTTDNHVLNLSEVEARLKNRER